MVTFRREDAAKALVWSVPEGWWGLSSASVGGGLVRPGWVTNLDVGDDFTRTDLERYAAERAAGLGLTGPGATLLTAADVAQVVAITAGGVRAWATVGVTKPTWPVPPGGTCHDGVSGRGAYTPGTINTVVVVPVPLSASALVQAVGTLTEAKAQALVEAGVPGTGTASDAAVVLSPEPPAGDDGEPFAGVRSTWGGRVAKAVHAAVRDGLVAHPWRPDDGDGAGVVW
ncbi:Adenosylcobinamide amidohydrolase [Serinicoccus hydrothermalis]|uniref:Adenosylcobinamide amidohydrolase n=1 Tax=Serinicoccus hydrothermalis TaxID=1758689 RepID=A0A1B1NDV6_9MICO|nr:adenosylcobinamide amidohydrolase [Serinicoccus hydrothermalis]ANS79535.1 Adenosylcobinamide amidohydrolase [Serinicoccus hydrothermalis]